MTTTTDTISDEQIEQLRDEAGSAGDRAQVALCDRALGIEMWGISWQATSQNQSRSENHTDAALSAADIDGDAGYTSREEADAAIADAPETLMGRLVHGGPTVNIAGTLRRVGALSIEEARTECLLVIRDTDAQA